MKTIISSFAVLAALSVSVPSFALVRELASCVTTDGQYTVTVEDNQGIGPVRKSNVGARVEDADGNTLASWAVEVDTRPHSISFGRPGYIDTQTMGQEFNLRGPSTNFHKYSLSAKWDSGEISDAQLNCTVFGGTILQ